MRLKLSPEYLVAKYIKSATNSKRTPLWLIRVLTLIIIALLITGTVVTIRGYLRAQEARKEYNYNKVGLDVMNNTYKNDNGKWDFVRSEYEGGMMRAERYMDWYSFPLYFFLALFIAPWVIIRLAFWIIDASKEST